MTSAGQEVIYSHYYHNSIVIRFIRKEDKPSHSFIAMRFFVAQESSSLLLFSFVLFNEYHC